MPRTTEPFVPASLRGDYRVPWLALAHAHGIGPVRADALLAAFPGDPEAALGAAASGTLNAFPPSVVRALRKFDWSAVEGALAWAAGEGRSLVVRGEPTYPPRLAQIPAAPLALFIEGDVSLLAASGIAVVGSRHAGTTARDDAHSFAGALAKAGLVVTSGLALGIDGAAHRGALQAQGKTVAVLATGLDRIYPGEHAGLAEAIRQQGALVSEMPLGTEPRAGHFPRRNRIISGLSLGVLVVEASLRSGSLLTANHALEQGREVFAIPGSIHNPRARGCHRLIRDGARLVEGVSDILQELQVTLARGPHGPRVMPDPTFDGDAEAAKVWSQLGYSPVDFDRIVTGSGLTAARVSSILLHMELEGLVHAEAGSAYQRAR